MCNYKNILLYFNQIGGYDEEQWPIFSTKPAPVFVMEDDLLEDSPKMGHKKLGESISMSGEMSGMVTLKRGKKAKDAGATTFKRNTLFFKPRSHEEIYGDKVPPMSRQEKMEIWERFWAEKGLM